MTKEQIVQQMQVSGKFLRDSDVDPQLVTFGSGGPKALISFEKDEAGAIQVDLKVSGFANPQDFANAIGQVARAILEGTKQPASGK